MDSYLIGITLPLALEEEIETWRRRFGAPRTAPHITLIPPFAWGESYTVLAAAVESVSVRHGEFIIKGEGIGSFGKAVLFVNVELTPELAAYQSELARKLAEFGVLPEKRPYHPHITLATRLTPPRFREYLAELSDYNPRFAFPFQGATIFRLVTEGQGKRWQIVTERE